MATTFVIACPECKKQVKVSEEHIGKKVKCKECGTLYPVKAPAGKAPPAPPAKPTAGKNPPAPPPKKAAAPPPPPAKEDEPLRMADDKPKDDDDEDANPYVLTKTDDHLPRCPFCAKEMVSEEAIICLNCGYNTRTRARKEVKAVYEHSGGEIFMWHLLAIISCLVMIGGLVWYIIFWGLIEGWLKGSALEASDGGYEAGMSPGMFRLYHGLALAAMYVPLVRYCYKRFFVNPKPPEQKIKDD